MNKKQLIRKLTGATEITCVLKTDDCETESCPVHTFKFNRDGSYAKRIVDNEGAACTTIPNHKTIKEIVDWVCQDTNAHECYVDAHSYWDEQYPSLTRH